MKKTSVKLSVSEVSEVSKLMLSAIEANGQSTTSVTSEYTCNYVPLCKNLLVVKHLRLHPSILPKILNLE